nr:hypothetical protein [Tanacetum cinerariifolium]
MEILLEPTSNKLMVGYELMIDSGFFEMITLSMCHKITLASDMLIDFQIKFSISIDKSYLSWNPVKKILLKLNLSDRMSILTDLQVTPTKPGQMTNPYSSHCFIDNYFNARNIKMEVKVPGSSRSYTLKHLKKLSFDEIKDLFEATMRSINDFVPIESEDDKAISKLAEARSSKRDAEEELHQGRSKKQKIGESSEPRNKDVDELSQEELQ